MSSKCEINIKNNFLWSHWPTDASAIVITAINDALALLLLFLQKIWAFYKNLLVGMNSSIEVYRLVLIIIQKMFILTKNVAYLFGYNQLTVFSYNKLLPIIKNMIKNYINQVFNKNSFVLVQNFFLLFQSVLSRHIFCRLCLIQVLVVFISFSLWLINNYNYCIFCLPIQIKPNYNRRFWQE